MPHDFKNLLFDLDGTLTDSKEGIIRTFQHAFKCMNVESPPDKAIEALIGIGLRDIFAKFLNTTEKSIIEQAVEFYRVRYHAIGMFENYVFDGIESLLQKLNDHKFQLFVATAKPKDTSLQILEHFKLSKYFVAIHGPERDGTRRKKSELIKYILEQHSLEKTQTVMIGDHANDILAAQANNIASIAVTYGYGTLPELQSVNPNHLCHTLSDLESILF